MRKYIVVLGTALLAGIPACVDLNEDVVTGLTPGSYGTQAVFEQLVNASYQPLRSFYAQERGFTVTEFGTDIFTKGADGSFKYVNDYTTQLNPDAQFFRTHGSTSTGRSIQPTRRSARPRSCKWTPPSRPSGWAKLVSCGLCTTSIWSRCSGPSR